MYDREPIPDWIFGRVALLGDSAHAPLQYIAQGAVMAVEDGWTLAKHVALNTSIDATGRHLVDWDAALAAYSAVRTQHTGRVLAASREWGILWHHVGRKRLQRNAILAARDVRDYSFVDWLYGPTALFPQDEPALFRPIPLDSIEVSETSLADAMSAPPEARDASLTGVKQR
jgi:2-polyprenyl-6-methoxyphenol hydroxylase-like FAD-dependent oxidoreductase